MDHDSIGTATDILQPRTIVGRRSAPRSPRHSGYLLTLGELQKPRSWSAGLAATSLICHPCVPETPSSDIILPCPLSWPSCNARRNRALDQLSPTVSTTVRPPTPSGKKPGISPTRFDASTRTRRQDSYLSLWCSNIASGGSALSL